MLNYRCPKCREKMQSPDTMAGQQEHCPKCGQAFQVPKPLWAYAIATLILVAGVPLLVILGWKLFKWHLFKDLN